MGKFVRLSVQFKMLAPVTIKCWAVFVLRDMRDLGGGAPGSLNNFIKMTVQVREPRTLSRIMAVAMCTRIQW